MRRLKQHLQRSVAVHRAARERGATSIFVALSMVAMLGFTALAIDVGMMYHERAELQSSADAAVLAVAQDCGNGVNCTGPEAHPTAEQYAESNARDGAVNVAQPIFDGNSVRVNVSTRTEDGAGAFALTFAPVLGIDTATVGATSAAQWIVPNKGPAVLPIVVSPCDFKTDLSDVGAGVKVLQLHSITGTKKNDSPNGCTLTNSSGTKIPGGFGVVDPPEGECSTVFEVDGIAESEPGNDLPPACVDVLKANIGKTVLLPRYKDLGAQGNTGWYKIDGWVAFKLHGWRFPATEYANTLSTSPSGKTCVSPCTGLIGEFVEFTSIDSGFDPNMPPGPSYGASVVTMME